MAELQITSSSGLGYSHSHYDGRNYNKKNIIVANDPINAEKSVVDDSDVHRSEVGSLDSLSSLSVESGRLITTIDRLDGVIDEFTRKYHELIDFVNTGAHEIRVPLMPILGIAELLESELEEINKEEISVSKDQVQTIIHNIQKLAKLTSEILDTTKIESRLRR